MAKIALRVYQREIEALIDQGRANEAVAHCMHILKVFPKHLDTYRLLGQAFVELGRAEDAADIFKRLLLAVPDDFTAHIGMAILFDERNDTDSALWHMERAFEVQPANAYVQKELRRLYTIQRGSEPPKIRMTRGALARMYIKGELYQQGIAELQSLLTEFPERYDLQVLLAMAWFQAGQTVEAAEACAAVLKRYPYCLDANRIMTEIASSAVEREKTQFYRRRVIEMDPYAAFVKDSVFDSDQVPDAAVGLERLEYEESMAPAASDWQGGVDLIQEQDAGWARALDGGHGAAAPDPEPEPEPAAEPLAEEDIPDFLKAAGWQPFTGEGTEEPIDFETSDEEDAADEALAEALSPAEMPDWLKEVAPQEVLTGAAETTEAEEDEENVDEWLSGLAAAAGGALPGAVKADAEPESLPDWLQEAQPEATAPADEPLPDWLQELGGEEIAAEAEAPERAQTPAAAEAPQAEEPASAPPVEEALPDWLQDAEAAEPATEAEPAAAEPETAAEADLGAMPEDPEAAMKWLEALAARQGAKEEELVLSTAEERAEAEAPEWAQASAAAEAPQAEEPVSAPPVEEALPEEMPEDPEEARKWLEAVAALDGGLAAHGPEKAPVEAPPSVDEPQSLAEDLPAWIQEAASSAETETADWLDDARVNVGAGEEKSAEAEALPDWLSEAAPEKAAAEPAESAAEPLPDWLQGAQEADSGTTVATWLENLDAPAKKEPETLPEMAAQAEQAAEEAIDESLQPVEPVRPEEWRPLEAADTVEPPQRPKGTGLLSRPSGDDDFDPLLLSAQTELQRGNLDAAMDIYNRLIKKGRLLDEVIFDLREALYRYPVDVIVWQTLGDAYMRANRLQDALDAYTKAEELLR